jgi:hypothetical protein
VLDLDAALASGPSDVWEPGTLNAAIEIYFRLPELSNLDGIKPMFKKQMQEKLRARLALVEAPRGGWSRIMRIAGLLALTVMLSSQPAVAVKRHASIPEPLRGSWAPSADACKNEDKSVVVLSAKAYTGSERSCSVLWVSETASVRGPTYSARLRCTNQLSQKRSESNLIIRPDNETNQISIGGDFSNLKTYQRCSPSEPATKQLWF